MAKRIPRFVWKGEEFKTKLKRHIQQSLDIAAITLVNDIKSSFGSSGGTLIGRTLSGATKEQRAANRSKPGGPPNVDTGHLKRNIGFDRPIGRPLIRRIGTGIGNKESVGYALWLELGTRFMLPRPYLRPALHRNRAKILRLISRPMK